MTMVTSSSGGSAVFLRIGGRPSVWRSGGAEDIRMVQERGTGWLDLSEPMAAEA